MLPVFCVRNVFQVLYFFCYKVKTTSLMLPSHLTLKLMCPLLTASISVAPINTSENAGLCPVPTDGHRHVDVMVGTQGHGEHRERTQLHTQNLKKSLKRFIEHKNLKKNQGQESWGQSRRPQP